MHIPRSKLIVLLFALAFVAGLQARAGVLFNDNFNSYADGELRTVGSANWTRVSGMGNDLNVVTKRVFIDDNNADDDTAALSSSVTSGSVYVSYTITGGTTDPSSGTTGDYISAFVDTGGTSALEGRIFTAKPSGTGTNNYRLGVSSIGTTAANITYLTSDLLPNVTYQVVMKFDMTAKLTTMWVNPTLETDPSFSSPDSVASAGTAITAFELRQGTNTAAGDYFLDNVVVGTTFADVVPEPASLGLAAILLPLLAARRRRA